MTVAAPLLLLLLLLLCLANLGSGQISIDDPPNPLHLERYFRPGKRSGIGRLSPSSSSAFWSAYRGSWLRNHFEDYIGNRHGFSFSSSGQDGRATYPEWFETTANDQTCAQIPATVNAGRPPSDICLNAQVAEKRCICIKRQGSARGEYSPVCGQCRDPCALRFLPTSNLGYLQKLVAGSDSDSEVDAVHVELDPSSAS